MSGVGKAGGQQNQVAHQHQHRHAHGQGQGKGLKLGQSEEFRALKDAKKAGELEGPMGQHVKELASTKRAGETAETEVVSAEATQAATEKQDISVTIEEKLSQVVTSSSSEAEAQGSMIEEAFADNGKFFET